jgi:hypothetical protein
MTEDTRSGPAPWGIFAEIGTALVGMILLFLRPGAGELVFDWPRLFRVAVPVFLILLLVERRLSRGVRRRTYGTYPGLLAVALLLYGLSVVAVGVANRHGPSPSRWVTARAHGWFPAEGINQSSFPVPLNSSERWLVEVESWRAPGERLSLPVEPDGARAAIADPAAPIEVRVNDGFLRAEYVAVVRVAGGR